MLYYLYQITNLINNKIYVGVHKTDNLDDGYMGSGRLIKTAIKKYGIENFRKDILEFFDTEELMYQKEIDIVDEKFLLREDVYNMKLGGASNFYYVNKHGLNHKNNQHLIHSEKLKVDSEYRQRFSKKLSSILVGKNLSKVPWNKGLSKHDDERLKYISEERKAKFQKSEIKFHITEEHADKISLSLKKYWCTVDKSSLTDRNLKISRSLEGRKVSDTTRNKLKNKKWINKDGVSKFVNIEELGLYLNNNWNLGRI